MITNSISDAPGDPLWCRPVATELGDLRIFWRGNVHQCSVIAIRLPEGSAPAGSVPWDNRGKEGECPPGGVPSSLAALEKEIRSSLKGGALRDPSLDLLDMNRCYDFQRTVLMGLRRVPRGLTVSYGTLARAIGVPRAARAVGTALARNPFPLAFPCHRVIRASGEIGHFGGGPTMKEFLLRREGVVFTRRGVVSPQCIKVDI